MWINNCFFCLQGCLPNNNPVALSNLFPGEITGTGDTLFPCFDRDISTERTGLEKRLNTVIGGTPFLRKKRKHNQILGKELIIGIAKMQAQTGVAGDFRMLKINLKIFQANLGSPLSLFMADFSLLKKGGQIFLSKGKILLPIIKAPLIADNQFVA